MSFNVEGIHKVHLDPFIGWSRDDPGTVHVVWVVLRVVGGREIATGHTAGQKEGAWAEMKRIVSCSRSSLVMKNNFFNMHEQIKQTSSNSLFCLLKTYFFTVRFILSANKIWYKYFSEE